MVNQSDGAPAASNRVSWLRSLLSLAPNTLSGLNFHVRSSWQSVVIASGGTNSTTPLATRSRYSLSHSLLLATRYSLLATCYSLPPPYCCRWNAKQGSKESAHVLDWTNITYLTGIERGLYMCVHSTLTHGWWGGRGATPRTRLREPKVTQVFE